MIRLLLEGWAVCAATHAVLWLSRSPGIVDVG